jgi:predicted DNA-binding transcriptional regulator AlpA
MSVENENKLTGWREQLCLTPAQVALLLNVSLRTMYRSVAGGDLPSPVKIRGCSRFVVKELEAYIDRLMVSRNK